MYVLPSSHAAHLLDDVSSRSPATHIRLVVVVIVVVVVVVVMVVAVAVVVVVMVVVVIVVGTVEEALPHWQM